MNIVQPLKQVSIVIFGLFYFHGGYAEEVPDSVDTFDNQTITTDSVVVHGRTLLTSQDVVVTNTGHLTLNGPQGVLITSDFEVQLGGTLELNGGLQYVIAFSYDASGNRIRREKMY